MQNIHAHLPAGESLFSRDVRLQLQHSCFVEHISVKYSTDDNGEIHLGDLADIVHVQASLEDSPAYAQFQLVAVGVFGPAHRQLEAGRPARIPVSLAGSTASNKAAISLTRLTLSELCVHTWVSAC